MQVELFGVLSSSDCYPLVKLNRCRCFEAFSCSKLTIDIGLPAVGHMEFAMTMVTHKVSTRALGRAVGVSCKKPLPIIVLRGGPDPFVP